MIGNDIVDLNLAKIQSNWQRKGFLAKLFSKEEQEIVFSSEDKTGMVWRLWSMKEAAYKAHQRKYNLSPKFNPKDFQCSLISSEIGSVNIHSLEYGTSTKTASNFIYSQAFTQDIEIKPVSKIKENTSALALKKALITSISRHYQFPKFNLSIKKCRNSIPRLYVKNREFPTSFSITQHGKYSALIFVI